MVRMPPAELAALDTWIAAQPEPRPTRPEALRTLARAGLSVVGSLGTNTDG